MQLQLKFCCKRLRKEAVKCQLQKDRKGLIIFRMKLVKKSAYDAQNWNTQYNGFEKPTGFLSGEALKWIAMGTMLIDHIGACLIESGLLNLSDPDSVAFISGSELGYRLYLLDNFLRLVGRIAFPLFCFLLVEGFLHTKNFKRYFLRLGLFALISEIPFDFAMFGTAFDPSYQNVFWTLLFGLAVLFGLRFAEERTGVGAERFSWASRPGSNAEGNGGGYQGSARPAGSHQGSQTQATGMNGTDGRNGKAMASASARPSLYEQFNTARAAQAANMTVAELREREKEKQKQQQAQAAAEADLPKQAASAAAVNAPKAHTACANAQLPTEEQTSSKPFWPAWLLWPLRIAIIAIGCVLALLFRCDYSLFGVALIAILYLLRKERTLQTVAGAVCCIWEPSAILAFVAAYQYNGKPGRHARALKLPFYCFYPLHLLLLGLIRFFFVQPLF